jgi:hypothetical protein
MEPAAPIPPPQALMVDAESMSTDHIPPLVMFDVPLSILPNPAAIDPPVVSAPTPVSEELTTRVPSVVAFSTLLQAILNASPLAMFSPLDENVADEQSPIIRPESWLVLPPVPQKRTAALSVADAGPPNDSVTSHAPMLNSCFVDYATTLG